MIRSLQGLDLGMTADAITRMQLADGSIPWERGRHADPWNHVEAAMGLDVGERHAEAALAYKWLAREQRPDGSWFAAYLDGRPYLGMVDVNFCAYIATGVWHHYLATGKEGFLAEMWPVVDRAISFVVDMQLSDGSIAWARDDDGRMWPGALLTSCSSIYLSLRCAITIGDRLGHERPEWELAAISLGASVAERQWVFENKDRFAMDWYYPVLCTALGGPQAIARLDASWDVFVDPDRGCRCTSDRPWVTAGETAELIVACHAMGMEGEAVELFDRIQHLRDSDGLYFTGANVMGGDPWPAGEKTTWSAGAVLLAADACFGEGRTAGLFRGEGLLPASAFDSSLEDPV